MFGGVQLLFFMALFFVTPLWNLVGHFACRPDEHIVEETQTITGTASQVTTKVCCARRTDRRPFGKCNWGDGTWDEAKTMFVIPFALSLAFAAPIVAIAMVILRSRRSRS